MALYTRMSRPSPREYWPAKSNVSKQHGLSIKFSADLRNMPTYIHSDDIRHSRKCRQPSADLGIETCISYLVRLYGVLLATTKSRNANKSGFDGTQGGGGGI